MHTALQSKERDLHIEVEALKTQLILESSYLDKRGFRGLLQAPKSVTILMSSWISRKSWLSLSDRYVTMNDVGGIETNILSCSLIVPRHVLGTERYVLLCIPKPVAWR